MVEPVVYLLAFGLGLGATVVNETRRVSYVEFVGTGMVAAEFNQLYQLVELVRHAAFGFEASDPIRLAGLMVFAVTLWQIAI